MICCTTWWPWPSCLVRNLDSLGIVDWGPVADIKVSLRAASKSKIYFEHQHRIQDNTSLPTCQRGKVKVIQLENSVTQVMGHIPHVPYSYIHIMPTFVARTGDESHKRADSDNARRQKKAKVQKATGLDYFLHFCPTWHLYTADWWLWGDITRYKTSLGHPSISQ